MGGSVKWSRDLHSDYERATRDRTETWGRKDIERLFGVGRATAQSCLKAVDKVNWLVELISLSVILFGVLSTT